MSALDGMHEGGATVLICCFDIRTELSQLDNGFMTPGSGVDQGITLLFVRAFILASLVSKTRTD